MINFLTSLPVELYAFHPEVLVKQYMD